MTAAGSAAQFTNFQLSPIWVEIMLRCNKRPEYNATPRILGATIIYSISCIILHAGFTITETAAATWHESNYE